MAKKVKGLKKLNKAVSAELKPFGIAKATCATSYTYSFATEEITFKLTENEIEDIWFNEFIKEHFGETKAPSFILFLLHEVGHHLNNDEIDGALYDFCDREKKRIAAAMEENAGDLDAQKILEWQYFNLPDEIMATSWAVEYARKHPKKVKAMWARLAKEFCNFYEKNEIKD